MDERASVRGHAGPRRRRVAGALALATALGTGFFASALERDGVPALAVRVEPPRTQTGKVFRAFPQGQLFECDFADLRRIDVRVVREGPPGGPLLELELRRVPKDAVLETVLGAPALRSSSMELDDPAAEGPVWARFEFEPVPESSGGTFHFAVRPADGAELSDWSTWTSFRGRMGAERPWGDRIVPQPVSVEFQANFDDMAAICVAVDGLDAAAAEPRLELWQLPFDPSDPAAPRLIREGTLAHRAPIAAGYAIFTFPPVARSRWQKFRFDLELPADARVVGTEEGASCMNYHGVGGSVGGLIGATLGRWSFRDRDLHFRAFGPQTAGEAWRRITERGARGRLSTALAAWIATAALALYIVWSLPRRSL